MAIVMGLDQHRAQITAEWIDTDTGEIGRARISPALRGDVRRFLKRFAGQPLEVALEATTGWRFVAEELRAIGADVHLAEPAETAARRGNKKRAKTDRADARHRREPRLAGGPRALRQRAGAGRCRASDDRRARRAIRAHHPRAAALRAPPS